MKRTVICIVVTFIMGILGAVLNHDLELNFPDAGAVFAIATASGFIVYELEYKNKNESEKLKEE